MAEIKIEKKKRPVWPWLLLILLLALLVWAIYEVTQEPHEARLQQPPAGSAVATALAQPSMLVAIPVSIT